ncbi:hypothetical protein Tco_1531131 [Tanacetum coccineum]
MYYPIFTKAVITKDKTISMRNKLFMHTAHDDYVLSTMRFFSKSKDFQVYGALLLEGMTNQKMRNSRSYKTYLAYATGAATPKKARKFKKPASHSKKRTLIVVWSVFVHSSSFLLFLFVDLDSVSQPGSTRDTPGVTVSKKKKLTTTDKSKGIDLLSDVAKLEADQLKTVIKRRKQDTSFHQAGSSSDGTCSKPGVLDEPKGKSVNTNEGTGLKPRVSDVSKVDSSKRSTNHEVTVVMKSMYKVMMKMFKIAMMILNKLMMKELIIRIKRYIMMKNSLMINAEQDDGDEEDADMTDAKHVHVEQTQEQTTGVQEESGPKMTSVQGQYVVQAITTATPAIQNATTEVPPFISSHFVSSNYTSAFLNLKNLQSTKTEVVSMMDINVQHEVLRTSPLITILVSVIPEHTVFHPYETVTTAPAPTISSLLSSLYLALQQITPILTPTNTEDTTSTIAVPESQTHSAIHQRIIDLEKDVKELKNVDHSSKLLSTIKSEVPNVVKEYIGTSLDNTLYKVLQKHSADIAKEHSISAEIIKRLRQQYVPHKSTGDIRKIKMEHARKKQVPKETITSSDSDVIENFDQKTTLFNTMTKFKSFSKIPKNGALYHALMESIFQDEDAMDKGVDAELNKRKPDDDDKDECEIS